MITSKPQNGYMPTTVLEDVCRKINPPSSGSSVRHPDSYMGLIHAKLELEAKKKKEKDFSEIMQVACDEICKFVNESPSQEELDKICEKCPLAKVVNRI